MQTTLTARLTTARQLVRTRHSQAVRPAGRVPRSHRLPRPDRRPGAVLDEACGMRSTWVAVCSILLLGMFVATLILTVAAHVPDGSERFALVNERLGE